MCFQCVLKLGIVAWYQANKQYVSTVLCENKDNPQMKCCGKCYLRKQLNKTEGSGSQQTKQVQSEWVEFIPAAQISLTFHIPDAVKNVYHAQYAYLLGFNPLDAVFHPPPVA